MLCCYTKGSCWAKSTDDESPVKALLATAVSAIGGTERSGQTVMAQAVWDAVTDGTHLAVQAGTGTGKSLAYLVPAIARAVDTDEPVVVSTATCRGWPTRWPTPCLARRSSRC